MENSTVVKGVFFYTKKLDSELMVKCLQAVLNNLPNFDFTCIQKDENFLGYRVNFSNPDEEAVLEKQLMVSGQSICICSLKTFLSIQIFNETMSKREIENAIGDQFGKLLDISPISESKTYRDERVQVFADIPEIKAQEKFQESRDIFLDLPNKKSKLRVTLGYTLCKKDGHVTQDCNQVSAAVGRHTSSDLGKESVFADSTMKMDINIESAKEYAAEIGREEVMKAGYFSKDSLVDNKNIPEKKQIKKGRDFHSRAGQNPTAISNYSKYSPWKSNADEDEGIQILSHLGATPSKSEVKTKPASTESSEAANPLPQHTSPSPVPSVKRRKSQTASFSEDMNVLSESLQEIINNACERFGILDREKLQAFFQKIRKKSNVVGTAKKYTDDVVKLKQQLKYILDSYYNSTQTFNKKDKRFITWLEGRIAKFPEIPQE